MHKDIVAEWLLRKVVDPMRASELVGDQLEAHPNGSSFKFWMAIAYLVVAFSRRTLVAMVLSPVAGLLLAITAFILLNGRSSGMEVTEMLPDALSFHVRSYLMGLSVLIWVGAVFSLMRFGWRSPLTVVGLIASVLWSGSLWFMFLPVPAAVLAILWLGFVIFCVSHAKRRRALGILCSVVLISWLTALTLSVVSHDPHNVFGKWQLVAAVILVPVIQGSISTALHRNFIERVPA